MAESMSVVMRSRLEALAAELSKRLNEERSVFGRETVVVPSKGTARWLSSWLATHNKICSNIDFALPKDFIIGRLCGLDKELAQGCSQELVRWRIYTAFPALIGRDPETFSAPSLYINETGQDSPGRRWQLAGKLAACFDQYITLRPDMIIDWENRPDAPLPPQSFGVRQPQWIRHWKWQRALWLEVMGGLKTHPPREFDRLLNHGEFDVETLPKRVFAFGFSTMPPIYLDLLTALGKHSETFLYYLNPCGQYWADIKSAKETFREMAKFDPAQWCELHLDEPNELLASFGKAGREFFARLVSLSGELELDEAQEPEREREPQNALEALQRGVFAMLPAQELKGQFRFDRSDESVGIHSCHSRMREVEVLRDEILNLLERETRDGKIKLRPADILVMAPDIAAYTPFIRAVFGGDRRGVLRLDYSIADQALSAETPEAAAFLALLRIPLGRFTAEEVLAPLDCQAARAKFKLDAETLPWLRDKLREAGAAWGIDAGHRQKVMRRDGTPADPAFEANSWRFAIERILLGQALEPAESLASTFPYGKRHIAPLSIGEGDTAEAAGSFVRYFDLLDAFAHTCETPHTATEWQGILLQLVDDFLASEGPSSEGVLDTVKALGEMLDGAVASLPPEETIPYEVMLSATKELVETSSGGAGFLRGGITFCRMQPLRNIPAKAVCLLGLNDGEFPRPDKERGFDLLREGRRLCDRSPRDDDRQLFLDALMSARRYFRILYIGQDDKDNGLIPPSPAVEEFCEHFASVFGQEALAKIRFRHPLHPFSPRYFSEEARRRRLDNCRRFGLEGWSVPSFSFSLPDLDAAKALANADTRPAPPWAYLFTPMPQELDRLEIPSDDLARRLLDLPASFLRDRLGISIRNNEEEPLPDDEPFTLDDLQNYNLKKLLLDGLVEDSGLSDKDAYRFARSCGLLPEGPEGWLLLSGTFEKVRQLAVQVASSGKLPTFHEKISLPLEALPEAELMNSAFPSVPKKLRITLEFKTSNLHENGLQLFRPAGIKGKDCLAAWVSHLALNCCAAPVKKTVLSGLTGALVERREFRPLERAKAERLLALLACLCVEGSCRPLPLFPECAMEYAKAFGGCELEAALQGWPSDDAFKRAAGKWTSSFFARGEDQRPSFRFAFGVNPPGRMSSPLSVAERLASLGNADRSSKTFREALELECLFHTCAVASFLPLLEGLEPEK